MASAAFEKLLTQSVKHLKFMSHVLSNFPLSFLRMRRTIQERSDVETDDERRDVLKDESPKSSYPSRKERWRTILPLMGFTCCFYIGVIGWTTLLPQYILARLRKENHNSTVATTGDICHVNE